MQFIDTHLHLQDFKSRCATDIVTESQKAGVNSVICVSAQEKDWATVAELAEKYPDFIIPAFGLHPWYIGEVAAGWEARLQQYLARFPQALVGECGLDRLRQPEFAPQAEFFRTQINLAKSFNRPLVVHAVKATEWLESFWAMLPQKFVFHSFTGSVEMAAKIIKHGGYIGFNYSVLRSRHKESLLRQLLADKILLETDGPYQGPRKGQEVSSSALPELLEQIAIIRGENPQNLAEQIYQNSQEFIKIGK